MTCWVSTFLYPPYFQSLVGCKNGYFPRHDSLHKDWREAKGRNSFIKYYHQEKNTFERKSSIYIRTFYFHELKICGCWVISFHYTKTENKEEWIFLGKCLYYVAIDVTFICLWITIRVNKFVICTRRQSFLLKASATLLHNGSFLSCKLLIFKVNNF